MRSEEFYVNEKSTDTSWTFRFVAQHLNHCATAAVIGLTGNMVLVNGGFHTMKMFSEKCQQFGHAPPQNIRHPCSRPKISKDVDVKVFQFNSLPGSPTCLRPVLVVGKVLVVINQNERSLCCYQLATGWTVRRSNPGGGEIFRTRPDRPWGPSSLLYNGYRVFPRGKATGAWR